MAGRPFTMTTSSEWPATYVTYPEQLCVQPTSILIHAQGTSMAVFPACEALLPPCSMYLLPCVQQSDLRVVCMSCRGSCQYFNNIPEWYGAWPDSMAGFPNCG
jgi:hypothetical protein